MHASQHEKQVFFHMFNLHVKQYETLDKFEIGILFHSLTKKHVFNIGY